MTAQGIAWRAGICAVAACLSQSAHADWPDPHGTGNQQMLEVDLNGDFIASFAESEAMAQQLFGKLAARNILDDGLNRQLGAGLHHDLEAQEVFGVAVQQLFVFSAGVAFRSLATRSAFAGEQDARRGLSADGSILLGTDFLQAVRRKTGSNWHLARAIIVYHEVAHVLLMARNEVGTPQQSEARADWLVGYCIGRNHDAFSRYYGGYPSDDRIFGLFRIPTFAGNGDAVHGSTEQRATRVVDGMRFAASGGELDDAIAESVRQSSN